MFRRSSRTINVLRSSNQNKRLGVGNVLNRFMWSQSNTIGSSMPASWETSQFSDLQGRDLLNLSYYTSTDMKRVLWAALDLKNNSTSRQSVRDSCSHSRVVYISNNQSFLNISMIPATDELNVSCSLIADSIIQPKTSENGLRNLGRMLSSSCDAIFIDTDVLTSSQMQVIAEGAFVPVINLTSVDLNPISALSHAFTLLEHYGRLKLLSVSYMGSGSSRLFWGYAEIFPKLGVNLRYLIEGDMDPSQWSRGVKLSKENNTEFKQYEDKNDLLFRSHCASVECTDVQNKNENFIFVDKDTKDMELEWSLMHFNPDKDDGIKDSLLMSKHSLVWKAIQNHSWMIKALIAVLLASYKPIIPQPNFDGTCPNPNRK